MNHRRSLLMLSLSFVFAALFIISGDRHSASAQAGVVAQGWNDAFYSSIGAQGNAPAALSIRPNIISNFGTFTSITYNPVNPLAGQPMNIVVHVTAQCGNNCPNPLIGQVTVQQAVGSKIKSLGTKTLIGGTVSYPIVPIAACYTFEADYLGAVNGNSNFLASGTAKQTCFHS